MYVETLHLKGYGYGYGYGYEYVCAVFKTLKIMMFMSLHSSVKVKERKKRRIDEEKYD
jgi:hypothetical protein